MKEVIREYEEKLNIVFNMRDSIKGIHSCINKLLYPVAIVEEDEFLIFDCIENNSTYEFIKKMPTNFPLPKGVRAAFNLEDYDNKIAVVVTGDVFDSLDGYAIIFHEFAHCFQYSTCELKLKLELKIAQEYYKNEDYMWEITHPFPYDDIEVKRFFDQYVMALDTRDLVNAIDARKKLMSALEKYDIEYFIWQEWKEGFARFIEEKIREKLDLNVVERTLIDKPLNRVSFYETGSRYIKLLEESNSGLTDDVEKLFYHMNMDIL